MKKVTLILVFVFALQLNYSYAWEWEECGPPGIKANKICFFFNNSIFAMICVDSGMYLTSDYNGQSWEFHDFHAMDAISPGPDSDSIITIMNEGSYSDGIWSFNAQTGQFNVIHWCYKPNFIIANDQFNQFYVGYENGLLFSEDCMNWSEVPFFSNKKCIDMELFVVATTEETNNTYFSGDGGLSWDQLEGDGISELTIGLYGIVKGGSYSCGLYAIDEIEMKWENIFYSYNLNTIGMDSGGSLFVGWHNGDPPDEGIAKYQNNELVYYNDGLPNLNINSISSPMIFGATVIYCCTDGGAFSRVLSVGIPEKQVPQSLGIFPNPVNMQATIRLNIQEINRTDNLIHVYNSKGLKVDEIKLEPNSINEFEIIWDRGNLPSGIYYMTVKNKKEKLVKKFIIL